MDKSDIVSNLTFMNRRAVVLAMAAFAAVLAPATESHAIPPYTPYPVLPADGLTPTNPPPLTPPATMTSPTPTAVDAAVARQAAVARLAHRRARVVELTNAQRSASGLKGLTVNAALQQSAQHYANRLAGDGAFSHTDGSVLATRVTEAGYAYQFVGENLALGQTSPNDVVAAWMASPDHRANMLDGRFTQMGVGVAQRADGRLIWCVDFGWPKP